MTIARTAVMSIHSHHASRIYALTKLYEFRRVGSGFRPGDRIFIYETAPVSRVTGEAFVAAVEIGNSLTLGALEPDLREREHVNLYLAGALRPVALRLEHAIRYEPTRSLRHFGVGRAPQSYQFVEN